MRSLTIAVRLPHWSIFHRAMGMGYNPLAGVVLDSAGDIFGTTFTSTNHHSGTVFEIAHGTTILTTLHAFSGPDGFNIEGPVIFDSSGDLYGTTFWAARHIPHKKRLWHGVRTDSRSATGFCRCNCKFYSRARDQSRGHYLTPVNPNGQILTSDKLIVTLTASGPSGLLGTTTVNAANGVATFSNAFIDIAGTYTLHATDGAFTAANSSSFVVNPAALRPN